MNIICYSEIKKRPSKHIKAIYHQYICYQENKAPKTQHIYTHIYILHTYTQSNLIIQIVK